MGVAYFGIYVDTWTYISLLLFALIIFIIIVIATEKQRQRRHRDERVMARAKEVQNKGIYW